LEWLRPPAEHWVDRPEVYSSDAQPTGTNRPRACLNHVHDTSNTLTQAATRPLPRSQIPHPTPEPQCLGVEATQHNNGLDPPNRNTVGVGKSYGGHSERETPGPIPNP